MNEPHDELERRLRPSVEPLAPPLGSFERISRAARRRRFLRTAASSGGAAVVVVAVAGVLIALPGRGDRPPDTVASGSDRTSSHSVQSGSRGTPMSSRGTPTPTTPGRASESASNSPVPGSVPEPGEGTVAQCGASDLDARLGRTGAATGHFYVALVLTNTGAKSCHLAGYPGVSVLDGSHAQIGEAAKRKAVTATLRVTLRPGESASATIGTGTGAGTGECRPKASFLRVYPPGSYEALVIPAQLQVCDHIFTVTTLVSGTEGNHP